MNSIFTLAGAFSFFRREILLELPQYSDRTVSEDTDITFSLRERFPETVIACLNQAIAYVEPFSSFSALYSLKS
jgi:cellulose synthase/poly-beta-1,6-N-acetylglucosamine synthase-like glycosyltransferase